MNTCSTCVHGIKVSDKVQCTHPIRWGMLMLPYDGCKSWEGEK